MPPRKAVVFDLLTALLDSWCLWDAAAGIGVTPRIMGQLESLA
jgi:phosphoserine phosphatase